MKQLMRILMFSLTAVFIFSSGAFAAPNVSDGYMSYSNSSLDWGTLGSDKITNFTNGFNKSTNLTNVSVEEQYAAGNNDYDVEELGLYISTDTLYIGLQTEFNLNKTTGSNATGVLAGDFIFNFDQSSNGSFDATFADNVDSDDFAFDFTIDGDGNVDLRLLAGSGMTGSTTSDYDNFGKDWEKTGTVLHTFEDVGKLSLGYDENYWNHETYNGRYTLEAAISFTELSNILSTMAGITISDYDSVTMYWQPSCGNDFLAARSDIPSTSSNDPESPVPEPETLLLFGFGLIGASIFGRKRFQA